MRNNVQSTIQRLHVGFLGFSCVFLLCTVFLCEAVAAAMPAGERLFPASTKGFVSVRNLSVMQSKWKETQFGKLMNEPIMAKFRQDMRQKLAAGLEKRFGLTLDSIAELPSGEVAVGMISVTNATPGFVITMDVADRVEQTQNYLARLAEKLSALGVNQSAGEYSGLPYSVFEFSPRPNADGTEKPTVRVFYLLKGSVLLIADQEHLLKLMANRLDDFSQDALADVANYKAVMQRCQEDTPADVQPDVIWFLDPLDYGESIRLQDEEKRSTRTSIFSTLKAQGFDAIQGIGGTVCLKTEGMETVSRVFINTVKPYRLAMRMLDFADTADFVPPAWLPSNLARCTTVSVNPMAIFDNFGTFFDAVVMQGEEGVWADILHGLETDPEGSQINIREEIIAHLSERAIGMSQYEPSEEGTTENIVIAVELKKGSDQAIKDALKKLFGNDSQMEQVEHNGYTLWHTLPAEEVIMPIAINTPPGLVNTAYADTTNFDEGSAPLFPDGTLTAGNGYLFVSTHLNYLKATLDRVNAKEQAEHPIKEQTEYVRVSKILATMGMAQKPHFLKFFARTDETVRPTYELIRLGKMAQSKTLLAQALNGFFASDDDETGTARQQVIDGKNLPEFELIKNFFGSVGVIACTETEGYFIKGFSVAR